MRSAALQPRTQPNPWAVLAAMCISLVLVVMSVSGLNIALPTLGGSSAQPPGKLPAAADTQMPNRLTINRRRVCERPAGP